VVVSDGAEYSINGGAFTAAPGTVLPGQSLRLRHVTAPAGQVQRSVLLVGGVRATFTTWTAP
jgi:hypothetical protein